MSNNFCTGDDEDEIEFNEFDYIMLFKALDPIRTTTKEFLENKINNEEAFKKIKMQYSTYACTFKSNVASSRNSRNSVNTLFKALVYILATAYTLWIIYDLCMSFVGTIDCNVVSYKMPLIYSLISIVLFNPAFSLVTISFEMLQYKAIQSIDKRKHDQLKTIEEEIEKALSCKDFESFTHEKVCMYYTYFDEDNLCKCGETTTRTCKDVSDNELVTDLLTNKMQKLDNVHQFFDNQKKFMLKIHNPFVEIKTDDKLKPLINCLLGNEVEPLVRDNLNVSDADEIFSENSQQIRNNLQKILRLVEGYQYKQLGEIESYQTYFLDELNTDLYNLAASVLNFLGDERSREKYFINNTLLKNYEVSERTRIVFRCDTGETMPATAKAYENDVLENMLKVQIKLKRLNKLWLPEYEDLRKALYEPRVVQYESTRNNQDRKHNQFKTGVRVQRAIYRATTIEQLRPLLIDIITIVLENTHLIKFNGLQSKYVLLDDSNENIPLRCFDEEDTTEQGNRILKTKMEVNLTKIPYSDVIENSVDALYSDDYRTKDTLLMYKIKNFINSLKIEQLTDTFAKDFKTEARIVKNVIVNELDELIESPKKVLAFINNYLLEDKTFNESESAKKFKFVGNCKTLIEYSGKEKLKEQTNSELYFNSNNEVEHSDKYIKYNEFVIKLGNIEKPQMMKYVDNVQSVKNDIVYFIDNIQQINNKLEEQHQVTEFYNKYIIIFIIVSFLILVDVSLTTYYGEKNYLDFKKFDYCKVQDSSTQNEIVNNTKDAITDVDGSGQQVKSTMRQQAMVTVNDAMAKGQQAIANKAMTMGRQVTEKGQQVTEMVKEKGQQAIAKGMTTGRQAAATGKAKGRQVTEKVNDVMGRRR